MLGRILMISAVTMTLAGFTSRAALARADDLVVLDPSIESESFGKLQNATKVQVFKVVPDSAAVTGYRTLETGADPSGSWLEDFLDALGKVQNFHWRGKLPDIPGYPPRLSLSPSPQLMARLVTGSDTASVFLDFDYNWVISMPAMPNTCGQTGAIRAELLKLARAAFPRDTAFAQMPDTGGNLSRKGAEKSSAASTVAAVKHAQTVDIAPELVSSVPPVYPRIARSAGAEGRVVLDALIGTDGLPHVIEVARGAAGFNEAAINAAAEYVFTPASVDGRTIPVWVQIPIRFSMGHRSLQDAPH